MAATHAATALMPILAQVVFKDFKIKLEMLADTTSTKFNPNNNPRYIVEGNSKNSWPSNTVSTDVKPITAANILISK